MSKGNAKQVVMRAITTNGGVEFAEQVRVAIGRTGNDKVLEALKTAGFAKFAETVARAYDSETEAGRQAKVCSNNYRQVTTATGTDLAFSFDGGWRGDIGTFPVQLPNGDCCVVQAKGHDKDGRVVVTYEGKNSRKRAVAKWRAIRNNVALVVKSTSTLDTVACSETNLYNLTISKGNKGFEVH